MEHSYWWITATDPENGKPYLIFGGNTEDEARQKGLEMLSGIDFNVRRLPTRDLGRASSMLKGKKLEDTHSLHKASERLGHERSIKRRTQRRTSTNDWN
jgi:hypothetical protein